MFTKLETWKIELMDTKINVRWSEEWEVREITCRTDTMCLKLTALQEAGQC